MPNCVCVMYSPSLVNFSRVSPGSCDPFSYSVIVRQPIHDQNFLRLHLNLLTLLHVCAKVEQVLLKIANHSRTRWEKNIEADSSMKM